MKERILTKNFIVTFLSLFCSAMVMYMLIGTITEYATTLGTTATLAGVVSGIYMFGGLCSRLYSGYGLAKIGWKKLSFVAMVLHFFACCCYFLVDNIGILILIRFVHGLGFGAAANGTMTIGMSILPKSRYGEAAGYFMMAPTLAIAVGPYAGGIIYDLYGADGCFLAASVLSALMLIFLLMADVAEIDPGSKRNKVLAVESGVEEKAEEEEAPKGLNRLLEVKAIPVSLCMLVCGFGYVSIMSFYRLYAAEVDLSKEFSYFFLFYAGFLLISRTFAGRLQDKYGDAIVCVPGIILQTIGLILIAWHPSIVTIIFCALGCSLGFGTLNAACNVIVCRNATAQRRSYAITTLWVCCDGGVGIGPALLGAVATAAGYPVMYVFAAMLTLMALPIFYGAKKNNPN